jgi:hypothetical protein
MKSKLASVCYEKYSRYLDVAVDPNVWYKLAVSPDTACSILATVPISKLINITETSEFSHLNWNKIILKNSVRTAKKTTHFNITKINRLTLFREIIAVYSRNLKKPVTTTCR